MARPCRLVGQGSDVSLAHNGSSGVGAGRRVGLGSINQKLQVEQQEKLRFVLGTGELVSPENVFS